MRASVTLFTLLAVFLSRHALVLAGLTLFVLAAAQYSTIAGLITAGVAFFFLELRRR